MAINIGSLPEAGLGRGVALLDGTMTAVRDAAADADQAATPLDTLLATPSPLEMLTSGLQSVVSDLPVIDRFRPGPRPQATPDGRETTTPQDAFRVESEEPLSQIVARTRPTVDGLAKIAGTADADHLAIGAVVKLPSGYAAAMIGRS